MSSSTEKDLELNYDDDPRIIPQSRLLSKFIIDKSIPSIPTLEERIPYPFHSANFFSELTFSWCLPILKVGYRRTLDPDDLFKIVPDSRFDVNVQSIRFHSILNRRKKSAESKYLKKYYNLEYTLDNVEKYITNNNNNNNNDIKFEYPSRMVLYSILETYKFEYITAIIYKIIADVSMGLNPLLVRALIKYVNHKALGYNVGNEGYGYAVGISCLVMMSGFGFAHFFHDSAFVGCEVKGLLTKVLFDKSFKLDKKSKLKFTPSSITSLLGTDLSKIDLAMNFFPVILNVPIGLGIAIALLAVNLGGAVLGGVAFFIFFTIIIVLSTKPLMKLRKLANIHTDTRIKYVKELLNSMKIIKYYSWEPPYSKLLANVRSNEMNIVLKIQFLRNCITALAVCLPSLSSMVGFLSMYGYNPNAMSNAANVFSSLSLFNILSSHITLLPLALSSSTDAYLACKRVQEYLLASEEIPDLEYHIEDYDESKDAIVIKDGEFEWDSLNDDQFMDSNDKHDDDKHDDDDDHSSTTKLENFTGLHNINLSIKHGEFIVITGSIGSGKSSLLSALNSDMPRKSGSIHISGNLLLCSIPWIQNTTVKNNIIFGKNFNEELYNIVIKSCALINDFEILPAGDETEIGERGVNLSGGQKARINLARSVYATLYSSTNNSNNNNNIIMLDDVLSAVDAKVGKHIMDECILGLLSKKTRILATHQLSLIGSANRIVFLNGDGTIDVGTRDELTKRNELFGTLMEYQQEGSKVEIKEEKEEEEIEIEIEEEEDEKEEMMKLIRKQTTQIPINDGKLMTIEQRQTNSIPMSTIISYLKSGVMQTKYGLPLMLILIIISVSLTVFAQLFQNVWLTFWSQKKFNNKNDGFYIGIYIMFTILFVLFATIQFCLIVYVCNGASRRLNIEALDKILHAPMSFFDTTPMGRILNRFTKDTDVLDNEISEQARMMFFGFSTMIGIYIMCIIYMPYFAICLPFIGMYTIGVFSYYQASSREVKRIESTQRSIVYSNFDEVLQGCETIKLYDNVELFKNLNIQLINKMNEPYFLSDSLQRWLAVSLHFVSALINLVISLLCVARVFNISAAASGLIISYLVQLSLQLISSSRAMGQLEQHLSSVERMCEYALDLPQEAQYYGGAGGGGNKPFEDWPQFGNIRFNNINMRYREGLPLVLKNLNIEIKPLEKIGICGRTGAGKSTIMTALYRLCEYESDGIIEIDNVDIGKIGLHDLRSKLSIIPQDPILFRGSIRLNLDPFNEIDDDKLYDSLVRSGCILKEDLYNVKKQKLGFEELHKFHLDNMVEDNGANFSLGQRQILALTRAIVKNSKILILDEATSSVDYETDAKIQSTIVKEFANCTILCIAHRLKTIVNYDRILVLDKGEVKQFDNPLELYNDKQGIFRSMCDKSGIVKEDFLY